MVPHLMLIVSSGRTEPGRFFKTENEEPSSSRLRTLPVDKDDARYVVDVVGVVADTGNLKMWF